MAQPGQVTGIDQQPRKRRRRSPSPPRPAFFVVQVVDESGEPQAFDKKRIKLLSVERSAERVLEIVEGGETPHAFYIRGIVPAGRGDRPMSVDRPAAA